MDVPAPKVTPWSERCSTRPMLKGLDQACSEGRPDSSSAARLRGVCPPRRRCHLKRVGAPGARILLADFAARFRIAALQGGLDLTNYWGFLQHPVPLLRAGKVAYNGEPTIPIELRIAFPQASRRWHRVLLGRGLTNPHPPEASELLPPLSILRGLGTIAQFLAVWLREMRANTSIGHRHRQHAWI